MIAAERRAMTASEADRAYGVAEGTARELWLAGRVRGIEVPGRGRHGRILRLFVLDLDRELCGATPANDPVVVAEQSVRRITARSIAAELRAAQRADAPSAQVSA